MKTRDVYLIQDQTLKDSDTVLFDLTTNLKILWLKFRYQATNGATSNTVGSLAAMISKILVKDGSNALASVSASELCSLDFFLNKRMPYAYLTQALGDKVVQEFILPFGVDMWDRAHYLDCSRYANPQISLTHSLTISATVGFATGTGFLDVIARVIDDQAPPYSGFIMRKEQISITTVASGQYPVKLPLDFPFQSLLITSRKDATAPDANLSEVKLSLDSDARIPFDWQIEDLIASNADETGEAVQSVVDVAGGTTGAWKSDLYYQTKLWSDAPGATSLAVATNATANDLAWVKTTGGSAVDSMRVSGYCPYGGLYLPFGSGRDVDDFLTVQGISQANLILYQKGAAATVEVVTNQLRV